MYVRTSEVAWWFDSDALKISFPILDGDQESYPR